MHPVKKYSPDLARTLEPVFGKDCSNLSRKQAFSVMAAAIKAAENTSCDFCFALEEQGVADFGLPDTLNDLRHEELLGLISFLSFELRYGYWASLKTQINYLCAQLPIVLHCGYPDETTVVISGNSHTGKPFYFQGDLHYVLAVLQHTYTEGLPRQQRLKMGLRNLEEQLFSLNSLLAKQICDRRLPVGDLEFPLPLSQQEWYPWETAITAFRSELERMQGLVAERLETMSADEEDGEDEENA